MILLKAATVIIRNSVLLMLNTFVDVHRLSEFDTRLVSWLVQNHLVMSLTAQKKDTQDPQVIHDFAPHRGRSKCIWTISICSTVADIRATNPQALEQLARSPCCEKLYEGTRRALNRGLSKPIDKKNKQVQKNSSSSSRPIA